MIPAEFTFWDGFEWVSLQRKTVNSEFVLAGFVESSIPENGVVHTVRGVDAVLNSIPATGPVSLGNYAITDLAPPTLANDAVTKAYLDNHKWVTDNISDFSMAVNNRNLNSFTKAALDMGSFKITNLAVPTLANDAATKTYVDSHKWIADNINDFSTTVNNRNLNSFTKAALDMGSFKITNLAVPTLANDAATKAYVDDHNWTAADISDFSTTVNNRNLNSFTKAALDMGSFKITNLAAPTLANDAATKTYVDNHNWTAADITDFSTTVNNRNLNSFTKAALDMGSFKITNLAAPTSANDAATKTYVDGRISGSTTFGGGQTSFVTTGATTRIGSAGIYAELDPGASDFSLHNCSMYIDSYTNVMGGGQYTYYAYQTWGGVASMNYQPYSLVCTWRIAAAEFNATSSIKKKEIVERNTDIFIDDTIEKFKSIPIVKYKFKDPINEAAGDFIGMIAEEVSEVLPNVVDLHGMGWVPSVLRWLEVKDASPGRVSLVRQPEQDPLPKVLEGAKIRIYRDGNMLEGSPLLDQSEDSYLMTNFKKNPLKDGEKIFVYGTYETSPTVAKNKIFEMAIPILQNVLKRLEILEKY